MRNVCAIVRKELISSSGSPMIYTVFAFFLSMAAFFFFNLLATFRIEMKRFIQIPVKDVVQQPNLNQWVFEPYFHTIALILVLAVPIFTMRSLADESRSGTFELLLTAPLRTAEIVIGKFVAVFTIIASLILSSCVFPLLLCCFGNPEVGPILSALIGLLLLTAASVAVGIAVSAWTRSQVLAGLSAMVLLLILFLVHIPVENVNASIGVVLLYLSSRIHLAGFVEGVVASSSILYFVSLVGFGLVVAVRGVDYQRLVN